MWHFKLVAAIFGGKLLGESVLPASAALVVIPHLLHKLSLSSGFGMVTNYTAW